jgi:hypothetical protein
VGHPSATDMETETKLPDSMQRGALSGQIDHDELGQVALRVKYLHPWKVRFQTNSSFVV